VSPEGTIRPTHPEVAAAVTAKIRPLALRVPTVWFDTFSDVAAQRVFIWNQRLHESAVECRLQRMPFGKPEIERIENEMRTLYALILYNAVAHACDTLPLLKVPEELLPHLPKLPTKLQPRRRTR
jgi:hypothetical protein